MLSVWQSRDIQAKFLLKNGADEVLYPARDVAYNLAENAAQIMYLIISK